MVQYKRRIGYSLHPEWRVIPSVKAEPIVEIEQVIEPIVVVKLSIWRRIYNYIIKLFK